MANSQKFLLILISFLAGIILASIWPFSYFLFSLGVLSIATILLLVKTDKMFLYLAISLLFGFWSFQNSWPVLSEGHISFYNGQSLEFEATICREVDVRRDQIKLTLCPTKYEGQVLISVPRYPEYSYGDLLWISGELIEPEPIEDFDYNNYLARYDIYTVIYRPRVKLIFQGNGNLFYTKIFAMKSFVEKRLNHLFPEPHASFQAGLLLGSRKGIPDQLLQDFNTTGLTHIIAISGYNITLIIVFISGLLKNFPRRLQIIISSIVIVVFVIFVGASAAVVRAGIMGVISLAAIWFGRKSVIAITLVLTAAIMSFFNPKILVYDVGFQLSFLATVGLIYVSPRLGKYLKIPDILGVREAFLLTIAAQITAVPIILLNFGRLSLISPLANILVGPLVPIAMVFGALAFLTSLVSFTLAQLVALPAWLALELAIYFTHLCAQVPYASVNVPGVNWIILILYYVALIWYLYKTEKKSI